MPSGCDPLGGYRFSLATNAERVRAEIMLNQKIWRAMVIQPDAIAPSSYCVIAGFSPHPEELARASVSKDEATRGASWFSERCEASSGDGARAPPHHEGL
jgi:hypothetical protein